jgi:hypothetical protein
MNRPRVMSCLGGADGAISRSLDILNEVDIGTRSPKGIHIDRETLEEIVKKLTTASRYVREAAQELEREVQ